MPLHLRRHSEVTKNDDWPDTHWTVLSDAGCQIGWIVKEPTPKDSPAWGWEFAHSPDLPEGEGGMAFTMDEAKSAFAMAWRAFLYKNKLSEDHIPRHCPPLPEEERRRLRLPEKSG